MTATAKRAAIPFGVAALLLLAAGPAMGCSCDERGAEFKRDKASVIFRGTIVELRAGKTVVFAVTRVWKGDVGAQFEMPALRANSMCVGFWSDLLKVGQELLVYAYGKSPHFWTAICGNHMPASAAAKDFAILGPGTPPQTSKGTRP